ncbi:MAG TPA: hypothetical protein VF518_02055, partial [Polyangia bacterium]
MTRYSDAHGCAARLCTEGYVCWSTTTCTSGNNVLDLYYHGCLRKPCAEIGCDMNYVCHPELANPNDCVQKSCAQDGDCDCGACVFGRCEK